MNPVVTQMVEFMKICVYIWGAFTLIDIIGHQVKTKKRRRNGKY